MPAFRQQVEWTDYDASLAAQVTPFQTERAQSMLDDARILLRKMRFEFDTVRNTVQSLEQIVPVPQGVQRAWNEYYLDSASVSRHLWHQPLRRTVVGAADK